MECSPDKVAAVIVEPLQGEGGLILPPSGYFQVLEEICHRHGVLLVMDDIHSAFYRTAFFFASEHNGIAPDMKRHKI